MLAPWTRSTGKRSSCAPCEPCRRADCRTIELWCGLAPCRCCNTGDTSGCACTAFPLGRTVGKCSTCGRRVPVSGRERETPPQSIPSYWACSSCKKDRLGFARYRVDSSSIVCRVHCRHFRRAVLLVRSLICIRCHSRNRNRSSRRNMCCRSCPRIRNYSRHMKSRR